MALAFTANGLQIQTYSEIFTELSDAYKLIYGSDINLDADSPDGQRVGIEAQAILDVQTVLLSLYNQLDPDLSAGVSLDKLIKLAGITRQAASQSTWTISVTTTKDLTLPANYTIKDDVDQKWQTANATTALTTGATDVTFYSVIYGAVEGLSSATFEQVTFVPGVSVLSASVDATTGTAGETDEALRIRRNNSLENPAYSSIGSLYAKIANLNGVTDVKIYENKTDSTNATLSLAAHSIWVIVLGGTDAQIWEQIARQKTGGTGLKGDEDGTWVESINIGNVDIDYTHEVTFDRPNEVPIYINIKATRKDASIPVDTALLKTKLATKTYKIAENALASQLYDYGYLAGTNFILSELEISDDDSTYVDTNLVSAVDGYFTIDTDDITVTEITP